MVNNVFIYTVSLFIIIIIIIVVLVVWNKLLVTLLLSQLFSDWLLTPRVVWLTILEICIWRSHRILPWSFSTTLGGISHFVLGTSRSYVAQIFHYTILAIWLWHTLTSFNCPCLITAVTVYHRIMKSIIGHL